MSTDRAVTAGLKITAPVGEAQSAYGFGSSKAAELFKQMMTSADFQEFLTLAAYDSID